MKNQQVLYKQIAEDLRHDAVFLENLPKEAKNVLKLLDEVENFTLSLRTKLMSELRPEKK